MSRRQVVETRTLDRGELKNHTLRLEPVRVVRRLVHLLLSLTLLLFSLPCLLPALASAGQSATPSTQLEGTTRAPSSTPAPSQPPSSRPSTSEAPSWWSKYEGLVGAIVIPLVTLALSILGLRIAKRALKVGEDARDVGTQALRVADEALRVASQQRDIELEAFARDQQRDEQAAKDADSYYLVELDESVREQVRRLVQRCEEMQTHAKWLDEMRRDVRLSPHRQLRCGFAPFSRRPLLYEDYEQQTDQFVASVLSVLEAISGLKGTVRRFPDRRRQAGDWLTSQVRKIENLVVGIRDDEANILMDEVNTKIREIELAKDLLSETYLGSEDSPELE